MEHSLQLLGSRRQTAEILEDFPILLAEAQLDHSPSLSLNFLIYYTYCKAEVKMER